MRITPCILCSPNRRRLYTIIILDLALAVPRVLPLGPSARKSLSRISITSGLYNYIFLVFIGFIVLHFSIICFVDSSVIQPFCILLQWVLINSHCYYYYYLLLDILCCSLNYYFLSCSAMKHQWLMLYWCLKKIRFGEIILSMYAVTFQRKNTYQIFGSSNRSWKWPY